ncbi:hypothetical protein Ccrd_008309, partial [Cynara cardunculus var. scolymus]
DPGLEQQEKGKSREQSQFNGVQLFLESSNSNSGHRSNSSTTETEMTQAYGEAWYWDKRYAKESTATFDWYQKYESLAPLLHLYVPPTTTHRRVLIVGCGNSVFSEGMSKDGYTDIVNIDVSSVVIDAMQKKYSGTLDSLLVSFLCCVTQECARELISNGKSLVAVWSQLKNKCCQDAGGDNVWYPSLPTTFVKRIALMGHKASCDRWFKPLNSLRVDVTATVCIPNPPPLDADILDKLLPGESSKRGTWELTCPVPVNSDGSLREGGPLENMDVHYIYVCTKV